MARLRHFALCVGDLEKSAQFYEKFFDLKRIEREDLEIGSAIYMSDGVINLALLYFATDNGHDLKTRRAAPVPIISDFRWMTSRRRRSASKRPAANSSLTSATRAKATLSANSRTRMVWCSTFRERLGRHRRVQETPQAMKLLFDPSREEKWV